MGDEVKAAAERLLELGTHSGVRPIYLYERAVREDGVAVARAVLAAGWRPEPPTAPGWWWWRKNRYKAALIVWVFKAENGTLRVRDTRFPSESMSLAEWDMNGGEWAGPLALPA
jgi:hypothetical protein